MPLSDHERDLLSELESAVSAEDPRFARKMHASSRALRDTDEVRQGKAAHPAGKGLAGKPVADRRRLLWGVLILVAGVATVVTGILWKYALVGGFGFALMVTGVAVAAAPAGTANGRSPRKSKSAGSAKRQRGKSSFMQRLESRWEQRRNDTL